MKIISANIGEKREIQWRKKLVETGIFKYPTEEISLGTEDVVGDHVIERKYHGGIDKACYLFSADAYPKFKKLYPDLDWNWGMFGENITVENLDEGDIMIGDQYQIGSALVEVSQPRQPCYKLGVRFGNQKVIKDFIALEHPGVYLRVLEMGLVKAGNQMELVKKGSELSVREIFNAIYAPENYQELINRAMDIRELSDSTKGDLKVL